MPKPSFIPARAIPLTLLSILLLTAFWAFLISREASTKAPAPSTVVQELTADPVKFAKDRVTGGIGAALANHPGGFIYVNLVGQGSPAEQAGLLPGDLITAINGQSTKGKTILEAVEEIRGFTLGQIRLQVLRDDTNLDLTISRASWNSIENLKFK